MVKRDIETRKVKLWWDPEGDFLEVSFSSEPGTMEPTADDRVKVMVSDDGEITGFHVMEVRSLKGKPRFIDLTPAD